MACGPHTVSVVHSSPFFLFLFLQPFKYINNIPSSQAIPWLSDGDPWFCKSRLTGTATPTRYLWGSEQSSQSEPIWLQVEAVHCLALCWKKPGGPVGKSPARLTKDAHFEA